MSNTADDFTIDNSFHLHGTLYIDMSDGGVARGLKPSLCHGPKLVWPMYLVSMYGHHIEQQKEQPGKVANPARGQRNRENEYSPVSVRA